MAETAHKILSAQAQGNKPALFEASMGLVLAVTQIVAAQRGVLVASSRTYMQQVQEAAGGTCAWTSAHRLLVDPVESVSAASAEARRVAALRLYQETVGLLRASIQPEHRAVVERTVAVIDAALLQLYPADRFPQQ